MEHLSDFIQFEIPGKIALISKGEKFKSKIKMGDRIVVKTTKTENNNPLSSPSLIFHLSIVLSTA